MPGSTAGKNPAGPRASAVHLLALLLAACTAPTGPAVVAAPTAAVAIVDIPPPSPLADPAAPDITPVTFAGLPGWADGRQAAALPALARACGRLAGLPADTPLRPRRDDGPGDGIVAGRAGDWRPVCTALAALAPGDAAAARQVIAAHLRPWRIGGPAPAGRFTGYYEAGLDGDPGCGPGYAAPVYGPPARAARAGDSRSQIAAPGWAAAAGAPLLFCARDLVAVFFLHIQGSGQVALPGGSSRRIGYAASNGQDYVSIGRVMVDRGLLPAGGVTARAIRDRLWAMAPAAAARVMAANPRYIFFRWRDGPGPVGAAGTVLTPGRSIAVDDGLWPLGLPFWIDTLEPGPASGPLRRLVVAQDTGAAIRGPVRADIFEGAGAAAFDRAGRMNRPGRWWLLLPAGVRPVANRPGP